MLRTAGPGAIAALRVAAGLGDAELDLALLRVGILPPADLDEIRSVLSHPSTHIRTTTNREGHVVIEIVEQQRLVARVHNDGQVRTLVA